MILPYYLPDDFIITVQFLQRFRSRVYVCCEFAQLLFVRTFNSYYYLACCQSISTSILLRKSTLAARLRTALHALSVRKVCSGPRYSCTFSFPEVTGQCTKLCRRLCIRCFFTFLRHFLSHLSADSAVPLLSWSGRASGVRISSEVFFQQIP